MRYTEFVLDWFLLWYIQFAWALTALWWVTNIPESVTVPNLQNIPINTGIFKKLFLFSIFQWKQKKKKKINALNWMGRGRKKSSKRRKEESKKIIWKKKKKKKKSTSLIPLHRGPTFLSLKNTQYKKNKKIWNLPAIYTPRILFLTMYPSPSFHLFLYPLSLTNWKAQFTIFLYFPYA